MTYLATLPGELRSLIFDHVDNNHNLYECLLVNKQFYMELMPLLWRHLDIRNKHVLTKIITTLAPAEDYIRSMVVVPKITEDQLLAIVQHAPLLEHLSLYRAKKITDTTFQQVARHCPRLISLYISNATVITQLSMEAIGQHCHQLREIHLLNCHGLDAQLFSALYPCPLEKISVNCCHLDCISNDPTIAASGRMALAKFSSLTSLHLFEIYNDCTPLIVATTNTNTDHLYMTSIWPCLTYLNLNLCPNLDDAKAIQIIKGHPQLTTLYLSGTGITDRTLDAIPLYLPDLVNLQIAFSDKVTASGLYRLVKHCTQLEDGVRCHGNRIYPSDHDFPSHLHERFYRKENHVDEERELSWLANDNGNK